MTASRDINGEEKRPGYIGRKTMASPAEGYASVHVREQAGLVAMVFSDDVTTSPMGSK